MSEPSADVLALTGIGQAYRWNLAAPVGTPIVVTYSFSLEKPSYDPNDRPGFTALTEAHKVHARAALDVWAQQSGIAFVEVPASVGGQIRFCMYDMTSVLNSVGIQASGFAYYPDETAIERLGGDIYLNANYYAADAATLAPGMRGFSIMIHEVGHAIGFKHPFEGTPAIDPAHDNGTYTVMSYARPNSTTTLGSVDIEASHYYYGAVDFAYHWSAATLTLTQTGTVGADWMHGTELSDRLNGLGGRDVLYGWLGNDTYIVAQAGDVVREVLNGGTDTVKASVSFTLSANVENLGLTGTNAISGSGNNLNNVVTGNKSANILSGRAGNDILKGGSGNDVLAGGLHEDTMTGGSGLDDFDFNTVAEIGIGATRDVITDFVPLSDDIDLSSIDANGGAVGDTAFAFLAAEGTAFTRARGQLRWFQQDLAGTANDRTVIAGDINGDATADFQIELTGLKTLTAADFIL